MSVRHLDDVRAADGVVCKAAGHVRQEVVSKNGTVGHADETLLVVEKADGHV